jgi:hypothetical protein
MDRQDRRNRAVAATHVLAGLCLLGAAAVVLVRVLPDLHGAEGEHMAGDERA